MAFFTNWAGALTDGVLISSGNERQVVLRAAFDAIIAQTSGEWLEVTGSSPTPAALQTYASTIPSTVTNANSAPTLGTHCTMYQANDPNIGSEQSRLIRLEIINATSTKDWMATRIIDTKVRTDLWAINPNNGDGDLFSLPSHINSSASTGTLSNDNRLFVFGDDNWLIVALYDVVAGVTQGVMGFYYPDTALVGFDRVALAYFFAFNAPPASGATQNGPELWCAAGSATPGAAQSIQSHSGSHTNQPADENLKYQFARQDAWQITTFPSYIMEIPRVRCIPSGAISSEFVEFTADTQDWLPVVKMDGVCLCIDLTS